MQDPRRAPPRTPADPGGEAMTGWDPRSADRIVSEVAALLAASLDMETTLRATAGSIQRMTSCLNGSETILR